MVGQYLKKGAQIYVEGSIRTEKWQDKNTGQDRYTTKIICNTMQMLDSKSGGSGGGAYQGNQDDGQQFDQRPAPAPRAAAPAAQSRPAPTPAAKNNFDDFDDDIPF